MCDEKTGSNGKVTVEQGADGEKKFRMSQNTNLIVGRVSRPGKAEREPYLAGFLVVLQVFHAVGEVLREDTILRDEGNLGTVGVVNRQGFPESFPFVCRGLRRSSACEACRSSIEQGSRMLDAERLRRSAMRKRLEPVSSMSPSSAEPSMLTGLAKSTFYA